MDYFVEIKRLLRKKGVTGEITHMSEFAHMNIDSLDLMDVIVEAEDIYGFQIPDEQLTQIKRVQDLIKILEEVK